MTAPAPTPIPVDLVSGERTFLVEDYGVQAQQEAERHVSACWEYLREAEEAPDEAALEALGDDPAVGAFCGCETCEVRETLYAAVPILVAGARREFEDQRKEMLGQVFMGHQPVKINLLACPNQEEPADA